MVSTLLPESRWNLSRTQIMYAETGKPYGLLRVRPEKPDRKEGLKLGG
jgi:hypothetical protein